MTQNQNQKMTCHIRKVRLRVINGSESDQLAESEPGPSKKKRKEDEKVQ